MSSDGSGDNNSLKDEINKLIADNKVMVFSATYCKFELLRIITNQHFGFFLFRTIYFSWSILKCFLH